MSRIINKFESFTHEVNSTTLKGLGYIELKESEVRIRINLGLMMLAMKPFLEHEIHLHMNEIFEET